MKSVCKVVCLSIVLGVASLVSAPLCFAEVGEELYFMDIPTVMSAGFFVTDRNKAPGNSTVISDKLIETSSIRTLEDVLEFYVPGASIGRHHYNGTQVGFRGVKFDGSEKTLVLWNGQDISLSSVGEWGLYQAPLLGDVKVIEVIDGPGAIVHGSGAISGFVDIVTKNGTEYPGLNSGVEYGFQDQSKKMELSYGKSYGADKDIFVYAGWIQAAGIYPDKSYHELGNSDGTISPDSYNDPYTKDELDGRRALYNRYPTYRVSLNANCGDLNVSTFFHQYFQGTNDDYGINRYTSKNMYHLGYGIMPTYVFKLSEKNTIDFSLPCYFSDFGSDYESNDLTPVQSSRDNSREYNMEASGKHYYGHSFGARVGP